MKCRLDGVAPDAMVQVTCVPGRPAHFQPSQLCQHVRQRYLALYGAQNKGVKQEMPRRCQPRAARAGEKVLKRKRQEELDNSACQQGVADVAQLETIAEQASKSRLTKKQMDLAKTLQNHALTAQKQFEADLLPVGQGLNAEKLQRHMQDAAKLAVNIASIQRPSLAAALLNEPLPRGSLVVVDTSGCDLGLGRLGARVHVWPSHTAEQVALCVQVLTSTKAVVWLCATEAGERTLLLEPGQDRFSGCARMIGGYVAGPQWLCLTQSEHKLVQPILALRPAYKKSMEICCHKDSKAVPVAIVHEALNESRVHHAWVVRQKWKNVSDPQCFAQLLPILVLGCIKESWFLRRKKKSAKIIMDVERAKKKRTQLHPGSITTYSRFLEGCGLLSCFG